MLSDTDIEQAASQLAAYRSQNVLPQLLETYELLISDYRRLKSDYEEERDAREKYKQMAKGQDRSQERNNPFVLVLVDGDGYVFHESLYGKDPDVGSNAAKLLNERIKASLRAKDLEHCQVMVRIYANVAVLSKALHKAGLAGAEKRSLAPFIASFNRSYGLAEFVDAGDVNNNTNFKLRALLSLYAENTQCKHIYFAACHDTAYISELLPNMGKHSRFTLVKTPGVKFHDEFTKLDLGIEELPGVFRSTPLESIAPYRAAPPSAFSTARNASGGAQLLSDPAPVRADAAKTPCRFYPSGRCKYGKTCKNLHVEDATSSKITWRSTTNDPQSAAGGSLLDLLESRYKTSPLFNSRSDAATDFMNGKAASSPAWLDTHELPNKDDVPEGQVAVNKNGFRLDPYIPPTGVEVLGRLRAHKRVCNNFHLTGFCGAGDNCAYDHGPLDEGFKQALELLARSMPCAKRGACRKAACTSGHVCQNADCRFRGGKALCKLSSQSHSEDLVVARYVAATKSSPPNPSSSGIGSRPGSITDVDQGLMLNTLVLVGEEDEMEGGLIDMDSD
ncbi:hypothetical protein G6O67_002828 [Ophiocordyceps sinensis]|uniref:C3H1-type domain-containing protein n=2 Tax=Ophiocordyceps sinensis TaxID=72228 RepID=A0A8H4PUZ6_9HYPO|nr:CCCH zinc finger DNA binding protein [Ophiocordyceps sinensis CO18]KAF4510986.1 hypothetical protein G6O67_002828 [Ophiocordyceps sinensis]